MTHKIKTAQDYLRDLMDYENYRKGSEYKSLSQDYESAGREAMKDTLGEISARTGGYASSYAKAAADDKYGECIQKLENAARGKYEARRTDIEQRQKQEEQEKRNLGIMDVLLRIASGASADPSSIPSMPKPEAEPEIKPEPPSAVLAPSGRELSPEAPSGEPPSAVHTTSRGDLEAAYPGGIVPPEDWDELVAVYGESNLSAWGFKTAAPAPDLEEQKQQAKDGYYAASPGKNAEPQFYTAPAAPKPIILKAESQEAYRYTAPDLPDFDTLSVAQKFESLAKASETFKLTELSERWNSSMEALTNAETKLKNIEAAATKTNEKTAFLAQNLNALYADYIKEPTAEKAAKYNEVYALYETALKDGEDAVEACNTAVSECQSSYDAYKAASDDFTAAFCDYYSFYNKCYENLKDMVRVDPISALSERRTLINEISELRKQKRTFEKQLAAAEKIKAGFLDEEAILRRVSCNEITEKPDFAKKVFTSRESQKKI